MEDIDMPDVSPPGLFFAGSDDDEPPIANSAKSSSLPPSSSPHSHVLFLEDSDDDSMYISPKPSNVPEKAKRPMVIEEEDPDIQIMKHSQVSAKTKTDQDSHPTSLSPTLDKKPLSPGPVAKKRRLLPPEHESSPNATEFSPIYLGEVVISNAWSNVSGKGYVKQNETVVVKREEQELPQAGTSKLKPTAVQNGKKQISIATMLKPQPAKSTKKKKKDNIVRLVNNKGSGNHCSSSPVSIR